MTMSDFTIKNDLHAELLQCRKRTVPIVAVFVAFLLSACGQSSGTHSNLENAQQDSGAGCALDKHMHVDKHKIQHLPDHGFLMKLDSAQYPKFDTPPSENEYDLFLVIVNLQYQSPVTISAAVDDISGSRNVWKDRTLPKGLALFESKGTNSIRLREGSCIALIRIQGHTAKITVSSGQMNKTLDIDLKRDGNQIFSVVTHDRITITAQ